MCNFHSKRLQKRQQLLQYKRQEGMGRVETCNFHAKRLQKTQQLLQYKRQEGMGRVG